MKPAAKLNEEYPMLPRFELSWTSFKKAPFIYWKDGIPDNLRNTFQKYLDELFKAQPVTSNFFIQETVISWLKTMVRLGCLTLNSKTMEYHYGPCGNTDGKPPEGALSTMFHITDCRKCLRIGLPQELVVLRTRKPIWDV